MIFYHVLEMTSCGEYNIYSDLAREHMNCFLRSLLYMCARKLLYKKKVLFNESTLYWTQSCRSWRFLM